jgi:hypothetical protein
MSRRICVAPAQPVGGGAGHGWLRAGAPSSLALAAGTDAGPWIARHGLWCLPLTGSGCAGGWRLPWQGRTLKTRPGASVTQPRGIRRDNDLHPDRHRRGPGQSLALRPFALEHQPSAGGPFATGASADVPAQAAGHRQGRRAALLAAVPDTGRNDRLVARARATRDQQRHCACRSFRCGPITSRAATAAASGFAGMIGGWH